MQDFRLQQYSRHGEVNGWPPGKIVLVQSSNFPSCTCPKDWSFLVIDPLRSLLIKVLCLKEIYSIKMHLLKIKNSITFQIIKQNNPRFIFETVSKLTNILRKTYSNVPSDRTIAAPTLPLGVGVWEYGSTPPPPWLTTVLHPLWLCQELKARLKKEGRVCLSCIGLHQALHSNSLVTRVITAVHVLVSSFLVGNSYYKTVQPVPYSLLCIRLCTFSMYTTNNSE